MLAMALLMAARASIPDIPLETWQCRNQLEVWCAVDGCAANALDAFTPMDIHAQSDGMLSVCAYTGCWKGEAGFTLVQDRALWTADALSFSSMPGGEGEAVTLLISTGNGVGFVHVGGLATPILCERRAYEPSDPQTENTGE